MLSQACCRQRKLKCPQGASQSGKIVKVFPQGGQIPRRTQMCSCRSSWAWRRRRPWPMIDWPWQTGHCLGRRSKGITPGSMLSFASGSAIKRITAGVKARRADRSLLSFDLLAGPSPSDKVSFERKKNTALRRRAASQPQNTAGSIGFVTIAVRCAGQRIGRSSAT